MEDKDFKILNTKFQGEKFKHMRRKGVFPYDYLDSLTIPSFLKLIVFTILSAKKVVV